MLKTKVVNTTEVFRLKVKLFLSYVYQSFNSDIYKVCTRVIEFNMCG